MLEFIIYAGREYVRGDKSDEHPGYFKSDKYFHCGNRWLHREKWKDAVGPIPKGWQVHHIDGDPGNNDITNLECVDPATHKRLHRYTPERRLDAARRLDGIRHLTKAWHSSPEGLAKHAEIGAFAYANFKPTKKTCKHCGLAFLPRKLGSVDIYCGGKCRSAARRSSGVDDESRACLTCGDVFRINRYKRVLNCSRSCGNKERARKLRALAEADV